MTALFRLKRKAVAGFNPPVAGWRLTIRDVSCGSKLEGETVEDSLKVRRMEGGGHMCVLCDMCGMSCHV